MIDSSVVRAHACAAGYRKNSQEKEALGRSKGGFIARFNKLEFHQKPEQPNHTILLSHL